MDIVPKKSSKKLMTLQKVGPAFSVNEIQRAHQFLDGIKVPRTIGEQVLDLPARISWLNGQLCSARKAAGMTGKRP